MSGCGSVIHQVWSKHMGRSLTPKSLHTVIDMLVLTNQHLYVHLSVHSGVAGHVGMYCTVAWDCEWEKAKA